MEGNQPLFRGDYQHTDLLAGHEIIVTLADFRRWELPSSLELHRLGRILDHAVPGSLTPTEHEDAFSKFGEGDVEGCMEAFKRMLKDREDHILRNNLAFCQILTGEFEEGLKNATITTEKNYEPLYEMNKGIAAYLCGDHKGGVNSLSSALEKVSDDELDFDTVSVAYVLVLDSTLNTVSSLANIPVEAAILINLCRINDTAQDELEEKLIDIDPDNGRIWLEQVFS